MRHRTEVTKIAADDVQSGIDKRARVRARERFGRASKEETASVAEGIAEGMKAEGYDGKTAYAATCPCGWQANNPIPTQAQAEEAAAAHESAIYGEE